MASPAADRKLSYVYLEKKVRNEDEIHSLLFEDDPPGEQPIGEWVVQKSAKKSPLIISPVSVRLTRVEPPAEVETTRSPERKCRESALVSPIKIKRKLSYAVNKVKTPSKKRPDIVSPILIKRIIEPALPHNQACDEKPPTIDLTTSEDDSDVDSRKRERNGNRKSAVARNRSATKKTPSKPALKTLKSKKKSQSSESDSDSGFEMTTPSKRKKTIKNHSDEDVEPTTPRTPGERKMPPRKSKRKASLSDEEKRPTRRTLSTRRLPKNLIVLDESSSDDELSLPVSARKKIESKVLSEVSESNGIRKEDESDEELPISSKIRIGAELEKENAPKSSPLTIGTPRKRLADDTPKKRVEEHTSPKNNHTPSKTKVLNDKLTHLVSLIDKLSPRKPKETPPKKGTPMSSQALSKADATPEKGVTPGKGLMSSTRTTPAKGATPTKSETPAKPRTITVSSSEDDEDLATPLKNRTYKKRVTEAIATPSRVLRDRTPLKPPTPTRRSARVSMSPSTPSLRQQVLLANTPRSSLPPVRDEDESEEELVTPRKTPKSAKKKLDMTPSTPLSNRKVGHGFLSPVVPERDGRTSAPSSALGVARAQLQVSTLPSSLPCREKEFNDIKSFITRKIKDGTGGCMYVSGVPGTGKTATVHTVIRALQKTAEDGDIPSFDFVEVNGLRLTEPRQAYVRIWQGLTKNKVAPDQALKNLENKFLGKSKRCTVLLVDELDYLCNRRQDVIYNILDWTTQRYSKLVVLTIANTMDLPERTLKGKVTSRMGLTRLVFQPYTYHQLGEIVLNRLDGCKAFHADAVQLVARKVAAVSGDARRALDICRRSTEILELEGRTEVSVLDIQKVLTQIFAGSRVLAIKNCSLMAKLILRAIRDEVLRTGVEETTIAFVHPQLVSVCALEGKKEPSVTDLLKICSNLADSGLIFAEKGRKDINRKISLNISPDDIHYAIEC